MNARKAIEHDIGDLRGLVARISEVTERKDFANDLFANFEGRQGTFLEQEGELETAAWKLRGHWLKLAHRSGDSTLKSPSAGHGAQTPDGGYVDFGYERELDVSSLERGRSGYSPFIDGWSNDLVVFRSGQAALAGILHWAMANWSGSAALGVQHDGAYFETRSLLDSWPKRILDRRQGATDVVIAEPIWCDGHFGRHDPSLAPRHALIVDTTMVGPGYDISAHLHGSCPLVLAYSSGLKLDQAGLELANVGIVRIYARDDAGKDDAGKDGAGKVATLLRSIRALTGTGLTLDELSALSAPWFMDREYAAGYAAGVFANNRALGQAVGNHSLLFEPNCHPSLVDTNADAPFCAFELREPSAELYKALIVRVEREISRRGLLAKKGGSFGFRGHRYELIEPEPERGRTFLRVALGWRDGHSRQGLCELFAELANSP